MKPKIMKAEIYHAKNGRGLQWGKAYYASGHSSTFGMGDAPKTFLDFIKKHRQKWRDTTAYKVEYYEVGHDKLPKHPD